MAYEYKNNDMFYDVESLSNVFTVAFWQPKTRKIILSYIDDDSIIKSKNDLKIIENRIYELHPKLKDVKIEFEDISKTGSLSKFNENTEILGMQTFAKRMGLANRKTYLNAKISEREYEVDGIKYDKEYYPVKETDPDYDGNEHGYRFGYNSANYDMTILAYMLGNLHDKYLKEDNKCKGIDAKKLSAEKLRAFNDELFEKEWKSKMSMRLAQPDNGVKPKNGFGDFKLPGWILRKAWLYTNRYIDVAKLNEKQQKVGLKRLLGMLGHMIMESDKLQGDTTIKTIDEFADLLAYNISDVVNLQLLFEHSVYQNGFNVRGKLLETYPQAVYAQKKTTKDAFYDPDKEEKEVLEPQADVGNYTNIRRDRLTRDSTSAKFVEYALAPYKPIDDIKTVSFMYPSENEAKKLGIERTDVLEDTKKFFEENVTSDHENQAHKDFMNIYNFYNEIRGKNFNSSTAYMMKYGNPSEGLPNKLAPKDNKFVKSLMSKYNTNLFYHYIDENGNVVRSTCLANFSVGGIHGAEVNMEKYIKDYREYLREKDLQDYIESLYGSALEAINGDVYIKYPENFKIPKRLKKKIKDDGTIKIREFIKGGSTKKKASWRDVKEVPLFKKNASGKWEVHSKYTYVSVGKSNHEDFTSYYPLLLSRLSVFINPSYHGYDENGEPKDPYYEMFLHRLAKKKESKDMSLPETLRILAYIEQDSRKLLINAASGAGDATFENNILASNSVTSMRIIGQLFAWRIGQAQALAGARVPSTNTDGLYTMDISAEENDEILEDISEDMHIGIDPERLDRFVSKDSNNRLEVYRGKITSAKGGTLNSWNGPEPTQALDHSAIIDHVLAKYLADDTVKDPTIIPFDEERAKKIMVNFIEENIRENTPQEALRFFQWILASSTGTHRYYYTKETDLQTGEVEIKNLQHYNRIFLVKEEGMNKKIEVQLATRSAIDKKKWNKRVKDYKNGKITINELHEHDENALEILKENGLDLKIENRNANSEYLRDEAKTQKVKSMPKEQNIAIFNNSIMDLKNDRAIKMLEFLDLDAYIKIVRKTFKSWSNL